MSRRYSHSYFITDDAGATTIASSEGLQVLTTWDYCDCLSMPV